MNTDNTFRLGVTLYSFNSEYYSYKYSLEDCLEAAASLGEGQGVEIVGPSMIRSYPDLSPEFEKRFRHLIEKYGLTPTAYGAYSDPQRITGRLLNRDEQVEYIKLQMRAAHKLGFTVFRIQAVEAVFTDLVPYAEKLNLKMGFEIHAPMMIETMGDIVERVLKINSPYLGFVPDCGAFCQSCAKVYVDRFLEQGVPRVIADRILELWEQKQPGKVIEAEVSKLGGDDLANLMAVESQIYFGHSDPSTLRSILPHIIHVHGKFFGLDDDGTPSAVRLPEIISILQEGAYKGYISCEYEGHHWYRERDALAQIRGVQTYIRSLMNAPVT
jgi:hypothetical protein